MSYTYDVESYEYAWLRLKKEDVKGIENPLLNLTEWQQNNFHLHILKILRNPKYLHWTVKQILNIDLLPEQVVILQELWDKAFPMYIASRGFGKSFLLAVYATLRCLLVPGSKIVIVGAAFRQSKVIFEYMDVIWRNAPILRSLCNDASGPRRDVDRCTIKVNDSWTIAVPLGDGTKIRGLRAHTIIADEFNSIPVEIYETVVAGFAAVSKDPAGNVKEAAKRKAMQAAGVWDEAKEEEYQERHKNQSILSGTAGYDFEPYADYWRKYKATIKSRGDMRKVAEDGENMSEDIPDYMKRLNWKEFAIIRMPYELIPEGFMDDQQVSRSRATMHSGIYLMEYGACFAKDSQGFFKRTLIESCVANEKNIGKDFWPNYCPQPFDVVTRGREDRKYVFGIDPASEVDNFAIIVIELHENHQRLVYSWTTNKKDFQTRKKLGYTDVDDYYGFCVRKIRDLMQSFPCVRIGIDSQGGGYAIGEGLRDPGKMREDLNEQAILPIIDEKKEKDTDRLPGLHILEYINFASAEWTSGANHGLRKDMEDKFLLYPRFDQLTLGLISAQDEIRFKKLKDQIGDSAALKLYDTLEDAVMDIEDLKMELSTIMVTRTASGREKFDTPEIKLGTGKKGRMRKDRYSALIIANMIGRSMHREVPNPSYSVIGRVAGNSAGKGQKDDRMYYGQEWASGYTPASVRIVKRT
jgi:hypothetical protein